MSLDNVFYRILALINIFFENARRYVSYVYCLLLVFSVTPFKIDEFKIKIKTIRQLKSRILEMKRGKYTKTLGQDLGRRNNLYTIYPRKCFTQIYRALYGDAMLELIRMSSNMADGNQQKHLSPSFATKA